MDKSAQVQITDNSSSSTWATIEQDAIAKTADIADLGTVYRMLTAIENNGSALETVYEDCEYVTFLGNVATVKLGFYVWLSDLDLDYSISCPLGSVSSGRRVNDSRSFNVVFNGTDSVTLPYLFTGDLTQEMPKYDDEGAESYASTTHAAGSAVVTSSDNIYTVLRAEGKAAGYHHTLTMTFNKNDADDQNVISDIEADLTLQYKLEDGSYGTVLHQLTIPDCVSDLLEFCDNGSPKASIACIGDNCDGEPSFIVYYGTCETDDILKTEAVLNE